jgi:hypothetical protein
MDLGFGFPKAGAHGNELAALKLAAPPRPRLPANRYYTITIYILAITHLERTDVKRDISPR